MLTAEILDRIATDPRHWTADSLDGSNAWYYPLSPQSREGLRRETAELPPDASLVPEQKPSPALREVLRADLEPVAEVLERGRGFAILTGVPAESDFQAVASYWFLGMCLGVPIAQNIQGTRLYDVRDTGQSVEYGARFSVTNADSSFHTDNSFGESIADYVGLLCLRTARSGGINHLVSGWTAYSELLCRDRNAVQTLFSPFHVDRRGGHREGESPTVLQPIIADQDGELLYRYLRYWIHAGHEKAGEPLTVAQTYALDLLDTVLRCRELQAEFALRPGEILWLNNRWLLHSRTSFEDYAEPERRRHLVRLWLQAQ